MKPSIEEQIEQQRSELEYVRRWGFSPSTIAHVEAVLATLSQHERAMAVVEAAREVVASINTVRSSIDAAVIGFAALEKLRAALDTAETEKR